MVANLIYMEISDCPSRVSVSQWSERRYVDSETLGSIPGWGSQSFRIYNYDRNKSFSITDGNQWPNSLNYPAFL